MSNRTVITGNLARPIELKFTPTGKAVANGRLADTPRRFNRDTQEWEDAGETLWVEFSIWDAEAEYLAEIARDYMGRVTVIGTLGVRSYEHQGAQRQQLTVRADSVALHAPSRRSSGGQSAPAPAGGQQGDPWGTPAGGQSFGDEPPF